MKSSYFSESLVELEGFGTDSIVSFLSTCTKLMMSSWKLIIKSWSPHKGQAVAIVIQQLA